MKRRRLRGLVLVRAALPAPFDRVISLGFAARAAESPALRLVCEIQGQVSNAILVDPAAGERILLAARQIGEKQSAARRVRVGAPYAPPPPPPGREPEAGEGAAEWEAHVRAAAGAGGGGGVAAALRDAYRGIGPALARDLCELADVLPSVDANALTSDAWAALHAAWLRWLARLASSEYAVTQDEASGRLSVLGVGGTPVASAHTAVEHVYRAAQRGERVAQQHARLVKAAAATASNLEKKMAAMERQRSSEAEGDATQRRGDLVMAHVHAWPPRSRSMVLQDWDSGEDVTVELPAKHEAGREGAVAYAEALYRLAAKQRRAGAQVAPLIAAALAQLEYVEGVRESLSALAGCDGENDARALAEIQAEMVAQGLMKAPSDHAMASKGRAKAARAAKRPRSDGGGGDGGRRASPGGTSSPFRQFTSPSGLQILVGRNNVQNDELSTRVANPDSTAVSAASRTRTADDVWMHARDVPGSHLIIRVPAGAEASREDIQFAANLSAYYSKAKDAGKCGVTVTAARNVRKFKGARPGQVLVERERTVVGRPSEGAAAAQ